MLYQLGGSILAPTNIGNVYKHSRSGMDGMIFLNLGEGDDLLSVHHQQLPRYLNQRYVVLYSSMVESV